MALSLSTLKTSLENNWLVPEGGEFPGNAQESAERFASAVASWFSTAQANLIPCTTAQERQPQLSLLLAAALASGTAASAAQGMASALALYLTGQIFGLGISITPSGTPEATTTLTAIFSNLNLDNSARAFEFAQACQKLALTTGVNFPFPTPPAMVI